MQDEVEHMLNALLQTIKGQSAREFLESLQSAKEKYGKLSPKQLAALAKFWDNRDRTKLKKLGLE